MPLVYSKQSMVFLISAAHFLAWHSSSSRIRLLLTLSCSLVKTYPQFFPVHSQLFLGIKALFVLPSSASPTTCTPPNVQHTHTYSHSHALTKTPIFYRSCVLLRTSNNLAASPESGQAMLTTLFLSPHRSL